MISGHTCITDDGGTPGRRCRACEVENAERAETILRKANFPSTQSVCKFPGCIAQANPDRDHCTIHYPENVATRAVQIVIKAFWPLLRIKLPWSGGDAFIARITRVRDQICEQIRGTT